MGEVVVKCWGTTEALLVTPHVQVHRIKFVKGGVCSWHLHNYRWNYFYVMSGFLEVVVEQKGGLVNWLDYCLNPGEFCSVAPGFGHRFEALEDGEALEIYYPAELSTNDIVRFSEGFKK